MMRTIFVVAALAFGACATDTAYFVSDSRVSFEDAEAACRDDGGHLAGLNDVDTVLDACRGSFDSGPCWVDLSSSEADYAITLDGHLMAVSHGFGEALAICVTR